MKFVRATDEAGLGEGEILRVELAGGDPICLLRVKGEVYAVEDKCTHAEYPLSDGCLVEDYELECPLHGAVFDIRDGSVKSPPAEESVKTLEVKIEDGAIWVRDRAAG